MMGIKKEEITRKGENKVTYDTPDDILQEGVKYFENKEHENALRAFNHLMTYHGPQAILLFYIGSVQMQLGNYGLAKFLLQEAIKQRPEFPEAINNLGYCHHVRAEYDEAAKCFAKAHEMMPESADMLNNIMSLYINNGTPDEAIKWANKALEIDKDHADALWNRGLAYLEQGKWKEGWEGYESGKVTKARQIRNYSGNKDEKTPEWDGKTKGTVVVYGEQGIGDEILFASMLPDVMKHAEVIFECHPRLKNLFHNSFPHIPIYGTRKDNEIIWPKWHGKIDYCISIGSLGKFYRLKNDDFPGTPYLKADPLLIPEYKKGDKKRIAIHWKGGTLGTNKSYRSVPLDMWKDLILDNQDKAEFISLQYTDEAADQVRDFNEKYGTSIIHQQDVVDNMDLTAAMLSNVDLVISVCTSIVHLSGAMGVKCWCLGPNRIAWRYGMKGDMHWYKSVKMFRQEKDKHEWLPVMERVNSELKEFLC